MSEQALQMGMRVRSSAAMDFLGFIRKVGAAVKMVREVQARHIVCATARRYSDADLDRYGWSGDEIRRLKHK